MVTFRICLTLLALAFAASPADATGAAVAILIASSPSHAYGIETLRGLEPGSVPR